MIPVYDTVFSYTRSLVHHFKRTTKARVGNDMILLIAVLLLPVLLFAIRPRAVAAGLVKATLFGLAVAAAFTVWVAGPHSLFIGIALVSGVIWLLLAVPRPRRARAFL